MDRRTFLGAACSAAAWPLVTPVVLAAAPGENRLVVIVLRGALDGIGMLQPHGDPAWAGLRPRLALAPGAGLEDLDGFFGLAEPFAGLMPLWRAGELGFVAAVSTPYRGKRSHFDGQDTLENGGDAADGRLTPRARRLAEPGGWRRSRGARTETAIAVGHDRMMILDGSADVSAWSPTNRLELAEDERGLLGRLYAGDRLFAEALEGARMFGDEGAGAKRETGRTLAAFAAERLSGEARIAAFSLGGWDTHRVHEKSIRRPAAQLAEALTVLKAGLGRNWDRTAVIAVTEFGRTARENGSAGTDHGTGGVALLAGGAMRGGARFRALAGRR